MRKPNYIDATFAKRMAVYENPEIRGKLIEFIDEQESCNELLYWFVVLVGFIGFAIGLMIGGAL